MQPRSLCLLLCAAIVLLVGCSKMPFKTSREIPASGDRVGDYSVSDSEATRKRLAVQDRLSLASQRLRSGDLVAAEREARAALKADPDSVDGHTLMAVINGERGELAESGVHYKRAAELAPEQG
ncbi:MAG: type IV pilus biogenesis/stability protein PilW, partial [Pseudoxanthomonas sp.]